MLSAMAEQRMDKIQDLIEEAKSRTILYVIFVVGLAYCLSLTSKSVWLNIPISILIISMLRYFSLEVEIQRRRGTVHQLSYVSHLQHRQLSPNDPLILNPPVPVKWKRRIDSPVVAAAVDELSQKIVQEFVTNLWYSAVTPDKEVPEQIRILINDVLAEIFQRVKHINLVDLLTGDMVDLIGSHLELYRRNQGYIGVDVMDTLSSEERDERLKHFLAVAKELHPALISSDAERKVLQRLMGGVVAIVLRPRDVQCPLVRCLAREILACAVMQPIMNFASPVFINELIEFLMLYSKEAPPKKGTDKDELANVSNEKSVRAVIDQSILKDGPISSMESMKLGTGAFPMDRNSVGSNDYGGRGSRSSNYDGYSDHQMKPARNAQSLSGDCAHLMESVRQRRAQILAPENLDNLWAKGRNYRKKESDKGQSQPNPLLKLSAPLKDTDGVLKQDGLMKRPESIQWGNPEKSTAANMFDTQGDTKGSTEKINFRPSSELAQSTGQPEYQDTDYDKRVLQTGSRPLLERDYQSQGERGSHKAQTVKAQHRRSKSGSTAVESWQKLDRLSFPEDTGGWSSETLQGSKVGIGQNPLNGDNPSSAMWPRAGNVHFPKLECWVLGVHFEKVGFKSFAVYSIAVTNLENKTWFVDRRYRNFEQLHRRLRDIPNYTLHLPPKRFISSSLDDFFIQQRCVLLDKYLKDLLSIPNIAERHEVWDFLSATSKNYSFRKTPSVMKTLACTDCTGVRMARKAEKTSILVNVDDAMVDLVRQFKGVSGGFQHKEVGTSSPSDEMPSVQKGHHMNLPRTSETAIIDDANWANIIRSHNVSDNEEAVGECGYKDSHDGWPSDSELHVDYFGSQANLDTTGNTHSSLLDRSQQSEKTFETLGSDGCSTADSLTGSDIMENEVGIPPEWTPPKLSVPLLNLVDKIFQLHRRGWLRRQVFWIAKQIVQLLMEDAIDDWLLSQIHWLRREDVVASGIRWIQNVIEPNGVFVSKLDTENQADGTRNHHSGVETTAKGMFRANIPPPSSFEQQLEAARRASLVYDVLIGKAPAPLVSSIGRKQYNRCAKDIYFFLQSTVCVKQLAYSLLELLLISIFPELHDLVYETRSYS